LRPTLQRARLRQFARTINTWLKSGNNLIIVLGTGSFGHPIAKKYNLEDGLPTGGNSFDKWEGATKTRLSVMRLMLEVAEILLNAGIPIFPVSPGNIFKENGIDCEVVATAIKNGLVPVLHGDMVFDKSRGCRIYSGDNIAIDLASLLKAEEIHFVTKGDGIFIDDVKVDQIKAVHLAEFLIKKKLEKIADNDVSMGFFGKLGACLEYVPQGGIRIYDGEKHENFSAGFMKNEGGSLIVPTFIP
jgi:isopentenyl phosphate kinase